MARQRNYAAEYARRSARAKVQGFKGYGQQRAARVSYAKESARAVERGWIDKTQQWKVGTEQHNLLMELKAQVIAKHRVWEPGKPKLSPDQRAQLERLFPDPKERGAIYGLLYD